VGGEMKKLHVFTTFSIYVAKLGGWHLGSTL